MWSASLLVCACVRVLVRVLVCVLVRVLVRVLVCVRVRVRVLEMFFWNVLDVYYDCRDIDYITCGLCTLAFRLFIMTPKSAFDNHGPCYSFIYPWDSFSHIPEFGKHFSVLQQSGFSGGSVPPYPGALSRSTTSLTPGRTWSNQVKLWYCVMTCTMCRPRIFFTLLFLFLKATLYMMYVSSRGTLWYAYTCTCSYMYVSRQILILSCWKISSIFLYTVIHVHVVLSHLCNYCVWIRVVVDPIQSKHGTNISSSNTGLDARWQLAAGQLPSRWTLHPGPTTHTHQ